MNFDQVKIPNDWTHRGTVPAPFEWMSEIRFHYNGPLIFSLSWNKRLVGWQMGVSRDGSPANDYFTNQVLAAWGFAGATEVPTPGAVRARHFFRKEPHEQQAMA